MIKTHHLTVFIINLFNNESNIIEFNQLVERVLKVIENIVQQNMNKEELEEYLTNVLNYKNDKFTFRKFKPVMITKSSLLFSGRMNK
jgi:hypothetical protein